VTAMVLTAVIIALVMIALVREWLEPDVAMVAAVVALVVVGVLETKEAFSGFANAALLTVAALLVVASGVQRAQVLEWVGAKLLGEGPVSERALLARVLAPTAALSAFMNNTPLVAVLIPLTKQWSRQKGIATSKMLMPISFAALLGGTCTLIGTSTNMLATGLLVERGVAPLGFFELTMVGGLVTVVGVAFMVFFAPTILPARQSIAAEVQERKQEFIAEVKVGPTYPHLGRTIEQAGLRHLTGLYLFQILRGEDAIQLADADARIEVGDRLFFTGIPSTIVELLRTPGLENVATGDLDLSDLVDGDIRLFEVTVSGRSPYLGQTIRDIGFRQRYDAAVLAIDRHGERVAKKLGDVVLHSGDTLLLIGDKDFQKTWANTPHFIVVTTVGDVAQGPRRTPVVAMAILAAMLAAMASGLTSPLIASMCAALLMIFFGGLPIGDARRAIDVQVVVILGASLALGLAVEKVGLASAIAAQLSSGVSFAGAAGLLLSIIVATVGISLVTSNQAAVALMIPVVLSIESTGLIDARALVIAVTIAASLSFATPMGYTTNVMVWGAGGYRFTDYVRLGVPLTLVTMTTAVVALLGIYT